MVMEKSALVETPALSVTIATNPYWPAVSGVPDKPPLGLSVNPGGRIPPVVVHVTGDVPYTDSKTNE